MQYSRDPLLETICDRINDLPEPAFIKDRKCNYIAVNEAFRRLFGVAGSSLVGRGGDDPELDRLLDFGDRERTCLVFGEDQTARYVDLANQQSYIVDMERFTLADGANFIFGVFNSRSGLERKKAGAFSGDIPSVAANAFSGTSSQPQLADFFDIGYLESIFELLGIGVCMWSPDFRLIYFNNRLVEFYRGTVDRIYIGMGLGEFVEHMFSANMQMDPARYPSDEGARRQWVEDAIADYARVKSRTQFSLSNGRHLQCINQVLPDGRVLGLRIDITDLKNREMLLESARLKSESFGRDLEALVNSIDVGILVLDDALNVTMMNDYFRKRIWSVITQDDPENAIGLSFHDFLMINYSGNTALTGDLDFEEYWLGRKNEILTGKIAAREHRIRDDIIVYYSGIGLSDGRFLLSYVDVTELRRRDREVAAAREEADRAFRLIRNATETMPEGLMVIEGERIVFLNSAIVPLLGIPEGLAAPGKEWAEIFRLVASEDPSQSSREIEDKIGRFRRVMQSGEPFSHVYSVADDRWVQIEMRGRDDGQTVILFGDVTETIRRERELRALIDKAEAADLAKSEFIANMSTEVRTPITGILGMAELLAKSPLDMRQKAFIDVIRKSGQALMTIVNDILDFSQIEAGQVQIKTSSFGVVEAVEDVVTLFAARAAEKDVELLVHADAGLPAQVVGDAGRFRQILTNLVSNAITFTDMGHVLVHVGGRYGNAGAFELVCSVEDTGIGIPSHKLPTIFDKFSEVDLGHRRLEGAGLGLAIAQKLCRMLDGEITVLSEEGKGSVFTVSLPLAVAEPLEKSRPMPNSTQGSRVIVVEAHASLRQLLVENLNEWGLECVGAADGTTALSIIEAAAGSDIGIDCVVLDERLPDMTTEDFLMRACGSEQAAGFACLLMSNADAELESSRMAHACIDAFVAKPVSLKMMKNTLAEVLRERTIRPRNCKAEGLPVNRPSPSSETGDGDFRSGMDEARMRVLVAEDNDVNQIFFSQILDDLDARYCVVANGDEALDAWATNSPDVILLDVTLPGLDGYSVAQEIRAREFHSGQRTPIIGVISRDDEAARLHCLAAGMDDFLAKPMTPEKVEQKLRHWVTATLGGGQGLVRRS